MYRYRSSMTKILNDMFSITPGKSMPSLLHGRVEYISHTCETRSQRRRPLSVSGYRRRPAIVLFHIS